MNLKKISLLGASCFAFMAAWSPKDAAAIPAYARQTGQSCSACHFQRYPLLNAYGRAFKMSGYTQKGSQPTIEDTDLSLPSTLNAAVVSKFRYQKTNGTGVTSTTNKGSFQLPDETSLFLAGRVAKNIGFQADVTIKSGAPGLVGFKMPFVFPQADYNFLAVPFLTDAQGAAYGYELLNTGAVEYSRVLENGRETSAQQYIVKDPNGAVTTAGVALVAQHKKYGYVSVTPYSLASGGATGVQDFAPHSFIKYIRSVYTHPDKLGTFDLAGGAQIWTGDTNVGPAAATTTTHASAWALDLQAQGKAGDYPLGVYLAYANAAKTLATDPAPNMFNANAKNKSAFTVLGDLGIIPSKLGLEMAYRVAKSGDVGDDKDNAFTFGAIYNVAKNVAFQLNHSMYSSGSGVTSHDGNLTTLVMFSAF